MAFFCVQVRALHVSQLVEHPLTVIGSCASSTYLPSSTLDLCACFSSPETGWDHEAGIAFLGKVLEGRKVAEQKSWVEQGTQGMSSIDAQMPPFPGI